MENLLTWLTNLNPYLEKLAMEGDFLLGRDLTPDPKLTLGVSHTNVCCSHNQQTDLRGTKYGFYSSSHCHSTAETSYTIKQDTTKGWTPNVGAGHETLLLFLGSLSRKIHLIP